MCVCVLNSFHRDQSGAPGGLPRSAWRGEKKEGSCHLHSVPWCLSWAVEGGSLPRPRPAPGPNKGAQLLALAQSQASGGALWVSWEGLWAWGRGHALDLSSPAGCKLSPVLAWGGWMETVATTVTFTLYSVCMFPFLCFNKSFGKGKYLVSGLTERWGIG